MTAISQRFRDGSDRIAGVFDRLVRNEAGATAVEYSMIVGLIAFAIIVSLTAIGRVVDENVFTVVAAAASAI